MLRKAAPPPKQAKGIAGAILLFRQASRTERTFWYGRANDRQLTSDRQEPSLFGKGGNRHWECRDHTQDCHSSEILRWFVRREWNQHRFLKSTEGQKCGIHFPLPLWQTMRSGGVAVDAGPYLAKFFALW